MFKRLVPKNVWSFVSAPVFSPNAGLPWAAAKALLFTPSRRKASRAQEMTVADESRFHVSGSERMSGIRDRR